MRPELYLIYNDSKTNPDCKIFRTTNEYLEALNTINDTPKVLIVGFSVPPFTKIMDELANIREGVFVSESFIYSIDKDKIDVANVSKKIDGIRIFPMRRLSDTEFSIPEGLDNIFKEEPVPIEDVLKISTQPKIKNYSLQNVLFSARTQNVFRNARINKLSDLVICTEANLLREPNFGRKSLREIHQFLEQLDLSLGMDLNPEDFEETSERFVQKDTPKIRIRRLSDTKPSIPEGLDNIFKEEPVPIEDVPKISTQPKIKNYSLQNALFSTRTENVFRNARIKKLSDLVICTEADLLRKPHFGRTSLSEVQQFLAQLNLSLGMELNPEDFEEISERLTQKETPETHQVNFVDFFKESIKCLDERGKSVIERRSGINGSSSTLEEIGKEFAVTRERIRQIERNANRKLKITTDFAELEAFISEKIARLSTPLALDFATSEYKELSKLDEHRVFFEYLQKNFFKKPISIVKINNIDYLCEFTKDSLRMYKRALEQEIKSLEDNYIKDIRENLRPEITSPFYKAFELLFDEYLSHSIIAQHKDGTKYLKKFIRHRSHLATVNTIVSLSDKQLSNDEIDQKIVELYPQYSDNIHALKTRLGEDGTGVYPLSFGTWGTLKHLDLDIDELSDFLAQAQKYASEKETEKKQFHSRELQGFLPKKYKRTMTDWHISAVLRESNISNYLGKNMFGPVGQRRRYIQEDIILILKQCGKPMTTNEIKSKIQEKRSISHTFQIHDVPPIKSLGRNIWTLDEWEN